MTAIESAPQILTATIGQLKSYLCTPELRVSTDFAPEPVGQCSENRMQTYGLIGIGSRPTGPRAVSQTAKAAERVAIIEKREATPGVCINTGIIPRNTMREA